MTTYLDNAATTFPKPESVYRAMDEFARTRLANPGRAGHRLAVASERMLDEARHVLNQFFNGEGPERFIFTLNCTDALNMAIKGVLREGDHVVTTNLEHNSVSRPLQALADAKVITLTRVPADSSGTVHPDDIRRAITSKTRLIVLTHASNVLGTVQPAAEIARIAREHEVLFLLDAAQTAGVIPIDIRGWGIDLLAFPGHKSLLGPTGTGGLYVGSRVQLRPWREGGTGGDSSSPTQPREMPYYLEGGTPNVLGIAGLVAGIRFVQERGLETIHRQELQLVDRLRQWLLERDGFEVYGHGDPDRRVATLSFRVHAWPASEVAAILDASFDIAVRPGLHCAPYIHKALGTFPEGTVRVSLGPFNTEQDIETLCAALSQIVAA
jgi:cysteine desulfurase/selenocysteine lyase